MWKMILTYLNSLRKHIIGIICSFCKYDNQTSSLQHLIFLKTKNAFMMLFFIFASLLFSSCIVNSKLLYHNKHKEGLRIYGSMPLGFGFFFIPISASSRYHIYNSLDINYNEIESGALDNINFYLLGKKLNLGSLNYSDVVDITPNLSNYEKIVESHCHDWSNEKIDEVSFYFGDQRKQYAAIRFFFESDTKKIQNLYIKLPFKMNLNLVKFENTDKSIEARFPFHGKDILLIFGEDAIIYKDYSL